MTKDEVRLLHMAVFHADWGTQMPRGELRKCYDILDEYILLNKKEKNECTTR